MIAAPRWGARISDDRQAPPPGPGPPFGIGGFPGRAGLLERVIEAVCHDMEAKPVDDALTVTLGDYVDRGPDSRRVIDRLSSNPFPTEFIALKGNHEALMEDFLAEPAVADHWRHLGGLETLHSYGVSVGSLMLGKDYAAAADALRSALPHFHKEFLASLPTALMVGRHFLCHAAIRPGVPRPRQKDDDLFW